MSRSLRVVHLPARTPYVRKITSPNFTILNGTNTEHGVVPDAVSAQWLLDRRPLDWLDVLHLHQIEFDDFATLARLFAACAESCVKIVYTAHDITAMFRPADEFQARMELVCQSGAAWIGLTGNSVEALRDNLSGQAEVTVIPHGFVVHPDKLSSRNRVSLHETLAAPNYLLYGALRPNRDYLSTIANWSLSITDPAARLNVLLRALSPSDFDRHDVPALLTIMKSDKRIKAAMRAYPTDDEVATAGMNSDALLLPYLFGSHSGQLELAFDLNLLPVCSSIGYLKDQYHIHKGLVGEPVWFDWSEGHPFLFGEKFVAVLELVHTRLLNSPRRDPSKEFLEYRRHEHERFLDAHNIIYSS
jgi:hypothetical protein